MDELTYIIFNKKGKVRITHHENGDIYISNCLTKRRGNMFTKPFRNDIEIINTSIPKKVTKDELTLFLENYINQNVTIKSKKIYYNNFNIFNYSWKINIYSNKSLISEHITNYSCADRSELIKYYVNYFYQLMNI